MSQQEKVLLIAALLMAHSAGALATSITRTVPADVSLAGLWSYTFSFSPIQDADELISVTSTGTLFTSEGGLFTLAVHTTAGATVPIYSFTPNFGGSAFSLQSIPDTHFAKNTIDGLTFTFSVLNGPSAGQFSLPQGSVFTFNGVIPAVPEPSTVAMFGMAGLAAWGWRRRASKTARQSVSFGPTSE